MSILTVPAGGTTTGVAAASLLTLPTELRCLIFEALFPNNAPCVTTSNTPSQSTGTFARLPDNNIFQVCWSIRNKAKDYFRQRSAAILSSYCVPMEIRIVNRYAIYLRYEYHKFVFVPRDPKNAAWYSELLFKITQTTGPEPYEVYDIGLYAKCKPNAFPGECRKWQFKGTQNSAWLYHMDSNGVRLLKALLLETREMFENMARAFNSELSTPALSGFRLKRYVLALLEDSLAYELRNED